MKQWLLKDELCLAILSVLAERKDFVDLTEVEKKMKVVRHLGPHVNRHGPILRSGFNRLQARGLVEVEKGGGKRHKFRISNTGREIHSELRVAEA